MRRLVTILLAAAALPAIGDTSLLLESPSPSTESFSLDVLPPSIAFQQLKTVPAAAKPNAWIPHRSKTCYYIRQLNSALQTPKAKPEFVPLADTEMDAEDAPIAGRLDCLPDPTARETGAR